MTKQIEIQGKKIKQMGKKEDEKKKTGKILKT